MKSTIFFLLFISFSLSSQKVEIKIDTLTYKLDEKFEVVFVADFTPDSTDLSVIQNFEIVRGPATVGATSIIKGISTNSYRITYTIMPIKPGIFQIESPLFYLDGEAYKGGPIKVSITGEPMTDSEIAEKEFQLFSEKSVKPEGTTRIIFSGDFGYVEEYSNFRWVFKRRLNEKEIGRLKKLR